MDNFVTKKDQAEELIRSPREDIIGHFGPVVRQKVHIGPLESKWDMLDIFFTI